MYSLLFTIVCIVMQIGLICLLFALSNTHCVLIGSTVVEIIAAIMYYVFLKYLFRKFKKEYDEKSTVKNFKESDESPDIEDKIDEVVQKEMPKLPSRLSLICALIAMGVTVLEIILIPIRIQNYVLFACGFLALVLGALSIYLMNSKKPLLSVAGFIGNAVIILVFLKHHGYVAALFFILAGCLLVYIHVIVKALKKLKLMRDDST